MARNVFGMGFSEDVFYFKTHASPAVSLFFAEWFHIGTGEHADELLPMHDQ